MKIKNIIQIIIFGLILVLMPVFFFVLPKANMSQNEKRALASAPQISESSVSDGTFMKQYETYFSDHFPLRNELVSVNAYTALYTGRNGSNGVYMGKNGYIIEKPVKDDYKNLTANIKTLMDFTQKTNIPSSLMIVPTTGSVMSEMLPANHDEYHDDALIDYAYDQSEKVISKIDIRSKLLSQKGQSQLFYRTDHHWTAAGAYNAYTEYCKNKGFEAMWDFKITKYDGFYGTTYAKSALWGNKPDSLEIWNYTYDVRIKTDDNPEESELMFYMRHLNEADKYTTFLDGNHPLMRITNKAFPEGKKLLVIKDSFAHCLVPFLIHHYAEIDMVDLRYYLNPVSDLVKQNGYDSILYLYGLSNLVSSQDIAILQ